MEQFIASPSLAKLDTFSIKVLRALAKELDIKLTSSALKKKQIRDQLFWQSTFKLIKFSKVTPKFTGKDVDTFFEQYELVAKNFDFPSDKWTIMLQTVLTGKAAEVFFVINKWTTKGLSNS